jgi:hypothetical protein
MKTALLVLCLLGTTAAFGQNVAGAVSSHSHGRRPPSHPAHAATHALAAEHYILGGTKYFSVQGDRWTWNLPQAPTESPTLPSTQSLGETARILREGHAKLTKARVVFEN